MFIAQSIRQPEQFYYANTLSSAKRWKTRRGADNATAQYPNSYLVLDESELGSEQHQSLFIQARTQVQKAAEQAYKNHSSETFSPDRPDFYFEELAQQAWQRYQQLAQVQESVS
ncbi:hypothetical protein QUB68_24800 [Microcoleus sp. A006_D1]|uniref:hypothetical protein n=1 Tax=Microcoleus sp. A006_D1 TaxID=3055267 RepID=UPI002FCF12F3